MKRFKPWINASRLRTLPLAASGVLLGSFIAIYENCFSWLIFILSLTTVLLLQILSNWANDYGDFSHGVDNKNRVGPTRTLQSGSILPKTMKKAIIILGTFTFILGITLLYISFKHLLSTKFIIFLIVGVAAIVAAIKYTIGKSNYGYIGLGDIMVFIFFGLAAVWGTYFLYSNSLNLVVLLPSISIGLLSTGVLNINNMRDVVNDQATGKNTLAVRFGPRASKIYHIIMIFMAILILDAYLSMLNKKWQALSLLVPSIPLIMHCVKVWFNDKPQDLDPELKKLSLSTLLIAIWTGIALIL